MNKGIKYVIAGLVAAGVGLSSYAANIEVIAQAQSNTYLTDADGNYTPGGWLLELGTFASTPTDGSSSLAGFSVFGTGVTGNAGGDFNLNITSSDVGFAHDQIYLVAFNAATQGAATEEGIYYVNDASQTKWRFPAATDDPANTLFDVDAMFQASATANTALVSGGHIVFGSAAYDETGPYTELRMATLSPVPEPSSIMLVVVGLLGMVGLIRRRS